MTRAAEFCYIAEDKDGRILCGIDAQGVVRHWSKDPERAIRSTVDGRSVIQKLVSKRTPELRLGFRKILIG